MTYRCLTEQGCPRSTCPTSSGAGIGAAVSVASSYPRRTALDAPITSPCFDDQCGHPPFETVASMLRPRIRRHPPDRARRATTTGWTPGVRVTPPLADADLSRPCVEVQDLAPLIARTGRSTIAPVRLANSPPAQLEATASPNAENQLPTIAAGTHVLIATVPGSPPGRVPSHPLH